MNRINLISNVTVDYIRLNLKKEYEVYSPTGYDNWVSEILNFESDLYSKSIASFFLMFGDAIWSASFAEEAHRYGLVDEILAVIKTYAQKVSHPVFISNIDLVFLYAGEILDKCSYVEEFENYWSKNLYKMISEQDNVYLLDISRICRRLGYDRFYSIKMWYLGGMPYSLDAINSISKEIRQCLLPNLTPRKKCLVLDLDNTLWGGTVAENDIELSDHGIGAIYRDFQRQIIRIKESGIVLAIISKNNFEDVEYVLNNNPNMVIHFKDVAAYRINWKDKWENIHEIAEELNIGLDSMVFVDDNPMEQSGMRQFCPDVVVPGFPSQIVDLPYFGYLLWNKYFYTVSVLEEDKNKTKMYIEEKTRRELRQKTSSLFEYIEGLQIEVDMHRVRSSEIKRVSELCNKTNQFNLTTRRYSEADIREFTNSDNYDVYSVLTKDRFGDNGLIAAVICKRKNMSVIIDSFFMSCRVMGRRIENAIVSNLIIYYSEKGMNQLVGEYIKSKKNSPVEKLYPELGFEEISENTWVFNLDRDIELKAENFFKNVIFEA